MSPTLILYRGWLDEGKYAWSPFVIKVEFRFRHAGLKYNTDAGTTTQGPKGKIPYIDLGSLEDSAVNPNILGDSTLIIQRLLSMGHLPDLNGSLSDDRKLQDLALRALLEEKLYFCTMRERWMDNFYTQRDKALWAIPFPMRTLAGYLAYRSIRTTLYGQGTGRLTQEEVRQMKTEIWQSFDDTLSQRLCGTVNQEPAWILGGHDPTEADVTLFAFITSMLIAKSAPDSSRFVRGLPNLVEYASRIHDHFFPDYEKWD